MSVNKASVVFDYDEKMTCRVIWRNENVVLVLTTVFFSFGLFFFLFLLRRAACSPPSQCIFLNEAATRCRNEGKKGRGVGRRKGARACSRKVGNSFASLV